MDIEVRKSWVRKNRRWEKIGDNGERREMSGGAYARRCASQPIYPGLGHKNISERDIPPSSRRNIGESRERREKKRSRREKMSEATAKAAMLSGREKWLLAGGDFPSFPCSPASLYICHSFSLVSNWASLSLSRLFSPRTVHSIAFLWFSQSPHIQRCFAISKERRSVIPADRFYLSPLPRKFPFISIRSPSFLSITYSQEGSIIVT